MKALLTTLGSHGDVHPFIGLGVSLRDRGHDVTLLVNGHFKSIVERAGLRYVELGTDQEYRDMAGDADLFHKRRGFRAVFAKVLETLERHHALIVQHLDESPGSVVIASTLSFAARVAREHRQFPLVSAHLQPTIFRSLIEPSKYPGLFMPRWLPMFVKRMIWNGGDSIVIDPVICPGLNQFRAKLGLPPVRHVLRDWAHSPDLVVGLFPDWYAPRQVDWPAVSVTTGFPLFDESGHAPLSKELERFLDGGTPPVAFTPGTAMWRGHDFFDAAVDASRRGGFRALLLSRHHEHIPPSLPDSVLHVPYAPFSELLPRVAALVHHGGIGSTAQCLRAGCPQLIMPMAHDQFDNAVRVIRMGVGAQIAQSRFDGRRVARALRQLLDDRQVRDRCAEIARRFVGHDGLTATCELIEQRFSAQG